MQGTVAKIRKTKESSFDRIYRYYHKPKSNQQLTPDDEAIRARLEKAWSILRTFHTMYDAANVLQKEFGIGKSVAYDDVNNAMMLFGDPRNDHKDAKRAIAEAMALDGVKRAKDAGDLGAEAKFQALYSKLNNLEGDDDSRLKDLLKKQRPVTIVFVADQDQLRKQAAALVADVAVDTEFEELNEADKKEG